MAFSSPAQTMRKLLEGPLTRPFLMRWRRANFFSNDGFTSHFGMFTSFEDARKSLPSSPEFNCEALTQEYVSIRSHKIYEHDYPVLWWLSSAFNNGARNLFDIGGSVGVHYYAYQRLLQMPEGLKWNVLEVPEVARVGERVAEERKATSLTFYTSLADAASQIDADIWLSAGALQYIEQPHLAVLLSQCRRNPRHLLLNKLPLYGGGDFVTAQNLGNGCFAPVHIYNRAKFVEAIQAQGYILFDEWADYERSLYLPGFSERSFHSFSGLYFVANSQFFGRAATSKNQYKSDC